MPQVGDLCRRASAALIALTLVFGISSRPRAQSIPAIDKRITYIVPQWLNFLTADSSVVAQQVAELRNRIGEGPRVRVGFTTYIDVSMNPVDPSNTAAIQAALQPTFDAMDKAIALGRANNIPVCLSFITAIRDTVDPLQVSAQNADRRNMQWRTDNAMLAGWTTFSRYARKQEAIQEAYLRELGRQLAKRMAANPDILVAASGDGEIELASADAPADAQGNLMIADYSPFAVAEFRDWLRGTGLYAPGQPFAGQAYGNASRYASDASIATLDSDFNIPPAMAMGNWHLKYFDWSLSDSISPDPNAIPSSVYGAPGFNSMPSTNSAGFDPPREHVRGNPWSDLWDQFRQAMVYRHNLEFAKWITTSADPVSGATVPADRWFTDQIPADYLFGGTPANPNGRLDTSGSSIATADVTPYGSLGITSFSADLASPPGPNDPEAFYARTLAGAAPAIAARHVRWGIFEWNPAIPSTTDPAIYSDEMALVKQYRPSVLAPFIWDPSSAAPDYSLENTGFETSLRSLVHDLDNLPLTLSRSSIDIGALTTGQARSPAQTIRVSGAPGESPPWSIAFSSSDLDVVPGADGRSFSVALKAGSYTPGMFTDTVTVTPMEPGYVATTLSVTLHISLPGTSKPPQGSVDTPTENAAVAGEVAFTGWAVDDIGLTGVSICRAPVAGETTPVTPVSCGGLNNIFVGTATFVPGARPDVFATFPGVPLNDQAGWGYMLLSNMLPNGGNGTYTISVVASDVDGHSVEIAKRHIIGQNGSSLLPFGTIDTPSQGQTISGSQFVNFGWALAPHLIPLDGSTISVLVDGVIVGRPTYGFARSDIDGLFPGYPNTGRGVGFFVLDTTTLANGVHSIAWVVTDGSGATQGIGSRFFTVVN